MAACGCFRGSSRPEILGRVGVEEGDIDRPEKARARISSEGWDAKADYLGEALEDLVTELHGAQDQQHRPAA